MLNSIINRAGQRRYLVDILMKNKNNFGVGKLILHYLRTVLNRIKWQQNRELNSLQMRGSNVPKNVQQANKLFIQTQQEISLSQKARMQRIDEILGTNTHYQDLKSYQQRLNSDHIMDIEQLKKKNKEMSRQKLDWLNPKVQVKIKYKNKKKYYNLISKLRIYPHHDRKIYDFDDQKNENTIDFLGKQTVYSKISLKPIELSIQSMQNEYINSNRQNYFESEKYYYFRPQYTMQLFRIQKKINKNEIINKIIHDEKIFRQYQQYIQQIISLDEIYEILKQYDLDERVNQYLKKIQNNRLQYFFTEFNYDRNQNIIAVMIDLLGTFKQYCLIVKNIKLNSKQYIPRVIFNVKPKAVFSGDGKYISYIQRSPEGGWIELIYRSIQTFWYKSGDLQLNQNKQDEIMYRCGPQKQLIIGTDSQKNYIFLTVKQFNKKFSESLFIIDERQNEQINLIELDNDGNCQYYYDVSPLGIILARYYQISKSYLKYGKNNRYASNILLIPYKKHIQIYQQNQIGLIDGYLPVNQIRDKKISPSQFDISQKKYIYHSSQNQFITNIETRQTHLVIINNIEAVYNKGILYFLPFKPNAHPHSIILSGGTDIRLRTNNYAYKSQIVQFSKPYGCLYIDKLYNIWKKQYSNRNDDLSRYHYQKIIINEGKPSIQISLICRSLYAQDKNLPVLIYFPTRNDEIQGVPLRQFLQKGALVIEFRGRGTFSQDLQHYFNGSRQNLPNMLDDLQQVIEFIGNNMSKNISLYCKGQISSLVGLWFNIYFPFLFNTTVLHNGLYDLESQNELQKNFDFFGTIQSQKDRQIWSKFNIYKHGFKTQLKIKDNDQLKIGTLQNIIISSDENHRKQSRKLIYYLRKNKQFKYDQVYLKQYENSYEIDLCNLGYIYAKMRTRMEEDINDPQLMEEQIQQK